MLVPPRAVGPEDDCIHVIARCLSLLNINHSRHLLTRLLSIDTHAALAVEEGSRIYEAC